MAFFNAIVRIPGNNFADGETSNQFGPPDFKKTLSQHELYRQALENCGLKLHVLKSEDDFPDAPFVEDTAVLAKEFALITNPGADSRKGEVNSIQKALTNHYDIFEQIKLPGTLDGGDICQVDKHFFIGVSNRTNEIGATQLGEIVLKYGYSSEVIDIRQMPVLLHLKSGMSYLGDNTLVLVQDLFYRSEFANYQKIKVNPAEDYAANCVRINDFVLFAAGFPVLASVLENLGYHLQIIDMTEFQKMDGGLSCLSLRF